jgi:cytochrome c biogenesis protein CcmG/thiol:disulfide interchange protein DsbE
VRITRLFAAILLAALALLSSCNRGARPAQMGTPAPDFTVSDGITTIHLASYRGRPVLVNFWATWCEPCLLELPSLIQLHHDQPGLIILAVSIDDDPDAYKTFLVRHHIDLITVRDPRQSAPTLFHTDMWPESYAIDQNGFIRRKFVGAQDWSSPEIRSFLKSL